MSSIIHTNLIAYITDKCNRTSLNTFIFIYQQRTDWTVYMRYLNGSIGTVSLPVRRIIISVRQADTHGVEIQVRPVASHTLMRISSSRSSRVGQLELVRLILVPTYEPRRRDSTLSGMSRNHTEASRNNLSVCADTWSNFVGRLS
jgi:hypothetical protein